MNNNEIKLREPKEIDYSSGYCSNCKYFSQGKCNASSTKEMVVNPEHQECFTGFYEPYNYKVDFNLIYDMIKEVINYYMDIPEDVQNLVTLWIIGTHFHEKFNTFPYLFINAMRGSGKTRLLKIIGAFAKDAHVTNAPTEAVMFRTQGTLCIDEFEGVGGKDKQSLRELLNSGYKKGTKIFRMKKKKTVDGESQVVEDFQPYRPICMANIWGMEEVLGDRCITTLIEKSSDNSKTRLIENFTDNLSVEKVKMLLLRLSKCSLCSVVSQKNIYIHWNNYIKNSDITTPTTHTTLTTLQYTNYTTEELEKGVITKTAELENLFKKIDDTKIDGRYLELFFPLFLIASDMKDESILDRTITFASKIVKDRHIEEVTESKDVLVYGVVAKEEPNKWRDVKEITTIFRLINGEEDWINAKWMGRALKRLNLVLDRRRVSNGMQVILDVEKAKLKEKIFKGD